MATLGKYDSALMVANGSIWEILKENKTADQHDARLSELDTIRANDDDLHLTMPDGTVVAYAGIGVSPPRPHKPTT